MSMGHITVEGEEATLATLLLKVENMDERVKQVETDLSEMIKEKAKWWKNWAPTVVAIAILGGGWVWSLSGQSRDIQDLKAGRYENRGHIEQLQMQITNVAIENARKDEQYKQIIKKLDEIQVDLKEHTKKER